MMKNSKTEIPSPISQAPTITADEHGMRVDRWFKKHFPLLGHGPLQKLLRTGQVRINGKRVQASDHLEEGQSVRLPPQLVHGDFNVVVKDGKASRPMRDSSRLKELVLYEDNDVVVLNKPAGLAVQGGTGLKENLDDSLMVFSHDGKTKPKLVHRLDRDTSGVLLIARNDSAARKLTEAFRDRRTQKIYWAVTVGVPKPMRGEIDLPLVRHGEKMEVVRDTGHGARDDDIKDAVTRYEVIDSATGQAAFVELQPLTGRTHQLRVHLASLGTPILGDRLYGGDTSDQLPLKELGKGLHLHAWRLVIPHPRKGMIDVTAPLSKDMGKTFRWFGFGE